MAEIALLPTTTAIPLSPEWSESATRWLSQASDLLLDAVSGSPGVSAPAGAWAGLFRLERPGRAPTPLAHAWSGYRDGPASEWIARVAPFRIGSADLTLANACGGLACARRSDLTPDHAWLESHARLHRAGVGIGEFARLVAAAQGDTHDATHLVMQIDGAERGWVPNASDLVALSSAGGALQVAFQQRIVMPTTHRRALLARISHAQAKVIPHLLRGLSERAIADRICRSPHTVHDHVKAIYGAWQIASRQEMIALWNLEGISPIDLPRHLPQAHDQLTNGRSLAQATPPANEQVAPVTVLNNAWGSRVKPTT